LITWFLQEISKGATDMPVTIINKHDKMNPELASSAESVSGSLLQQCGVDDHQVNIVFTDDNELQQLNQRYRDKDEPTNVLSFPFSDGADPALQGLPIKELGDIIISVDRAEAEAMDYDHTLQHRLAWLMTHGLLHLLGYDHEKSEQDAEAMYDRELKLLERIEPLLKV